MQKTFYQKALFARIYIRGRGVNPYFPGINFREFRLLQRNVNISLSKINTVHITLVVTLWPGIIWKQITKWMLRKCVWNFETRFHQINDGQNFLCNIQVYCETIVYYWVLFHFSYIDWSCFACDGGKQNS